MIKYVYDEVTFAEIPDEISLCISLSNCDGLCEGCHSAELREDRGKDLKNDILPLIAKRKGISCVCFLGESRKVANSKEQLIEIINMIKQHYPSLSIALYSGRTTIESDFIPYLDYYKVGPYIASRGPLNNPNTNQRLYRINEGQLQDITYKFWRKIQ